MEMVVRVRTDELKTCLVTDCQKIWSSDFYFLHLNYFRCILLINQFKKVRRDLAKTNCSNLN